MALLQQFFVLLAVSFAISSANGRLAFLASFEPTAAHSQLQAVRNLKRKTQSRSGFVDFDGKAATGLAVFPERRAGDMSAEGRHDAVGVARASLQHAESRRRRVVIYQGEAGRLERQQAPAMGNVSLLAGADGPLAFHSSFEPVAARSLLGSKVHQQQRLAPTSATHSILPRSGILHRDSKAATALAVFPAWRANDMSAESRHDATGIEKAAAQHAESRRRRVVIYQGEAGRFQQQQAPAMSNVSSLAGADGLFTFQSSFESVAAHSMIDNTAFLQRVPSALTAALSTQLDIGHLDHTAMESSPFGSYIQKESSPYSNSGNSFDNASATGQSPAVSLEQGRSEHSMVDGPLATGFKPLRYIGFSSASLRSGFGLAEQTLRGGFLLIEQTALTISGLGFLVIHASFALVAGCLGFL